MSRSWGPCRRISSKNSIPLRKPAQKLLRRSPAVCEQNVVEAAISNPKAIFRYVRVGTKKRDPIPGLRRPDGSTETNDKEKAQTLANHFQTVYTRESSLPEVGLPSHTENAKIEYVQVLCTDVKKILKALKKTRVRARMAFYHSL